jgi:hypothetical protein
MKSWLATAHADTAQAVREETAENIKPTAIDGCTPEHR